MRWYFSCEDKDTVESPVSRWAEAALAPVWGGVVYWMHNTGDWKFVKSWDKLVSPFFLLAQ